jgi:hypothetical protein
MSKTFRFLPMLAIGLAVVLTHLPAPSLASSHSAEPAKPGIKAKSKETWVDMKARWSKQKDRWAECQKQEKAEKRSRTATREFLDACMK